MITPEELIIQAKRIIQNKSEYYGRSMLVEASEFLRVFAGEKSAFFTQINEVKPGWPGDMIIKHVVPVMEGFIRYVENGLLSGVSMERKAQIDVVSDFLDQANTLLDIKEVHPAAPVVIIGAVLEEFLRNWIEEKGLELKDKKPCIDTYAKLLRESEIITKQDMKDITSWGGLRNHAAHGEWEEVCEKGRIRNMLEGVNLFMRKYS